jgi:quinolinate synthase
MSDIICTSSNAEKIIESVPKINLSFLRLIKTLALISIRKQEGICCCGTVPVWYMKFSASKKFLS